MYQINTESKSKRILKKTLLFFLLLFIIWVGFGLYLNLNNKNKKLEDIGYSNIEISIIRDILSNKNIKIIYNYDYLKNLTDLLIDNDFKSDKLSNYLNYYSKYPTISNKDLIYLVNNDLSDIEYNEITMKIIHHKSFNKEYSSRYNNYYNKYNLSIDDTIYAVNHDLDKYNIKYDKKYDEYMKNNYCILANLDRYYNYNNKHSKKNINDIISEVNSNLDLTPYENVVKSDTTLEEKILVNKYYYLESDYIPEELVEIESIHGKGKINKAAYDAYKDMFEAATKDGINLYISRGYITYEEQQKLYYQNKYYYEKAGFSENQTGLIIELSNSNWLKNNSYKYGFIQRYPSNKSKITGFNKPNYYRYVGTSIAKFIYENDITYEEYYAYFIKKK